MLSVPLSVRNALNMLGERFAGIARAKATLADQDDDDASSADGVRKTANL